MEDFLLKIPNWLRYILAIPVALAGVILFYYFLLFFCFGYATPDSLILSIFPYIYANFGNAIVFCYILAYILPKHQFEITIGLACFYLGIGLVSLILSISLCTLVISDIIAYLLTIIACVIGCYIVYDKCKTNDKI